MLEYIIHCIKVELEDVIFPVVKAWNSKAAP